MRFHFHRPLLEFARLLLIAVGLIFGVGYAVDHTPPTVAFVMGVSICVLVFFGMGVLLIRGAIVRRRTPRHVVKATQEQRVHPVLGGFTTYACDGESKGWSCTVVSETLGCEVHLWGHATEPSEEGIKRWKQLEKRLPQIIADIPPPPDDDGWGQSPGAFTPSNPASVDVILRRDSGYFVTPKIISSGDYMLTPTVHVDPDGEIWYDGWSC